LTPQRRGPKSKHNATEEENQKLRRQIGQLTEKLRKAEIIHRCSKKSGGAVGEPDSGTGPRGTILMTAITELAVDASTSAACQALAVPRASYYRDCRKASVPAVAAWRPSPARALRSAEREAVLSRLHEERLQDRSPAAVYATLLDDWLSICD
jgi:hypothetical protein